MAHRANCQRLQLAQVSQNGRCPAREVRVRRRGEVVDSGVETIQGQFQRLDH